MAGKTVVVLGGGTGGVVVARRLRRGLSKGDRVVVVERDPTYRLAPSFLWVLTGARQPGRGGAPAQAGRAPPLERRRLPARAPADADRRPRHGPGPARHPGEPQDWLPP